MTFPWTSGPAEDHEAVTPSDSASISPAFRALYVGGAGHVVVTSLNGTDVTYSNVPAGTQLMIAGTKVKAATTATLIVAMK